MASRLDRLILLLDTGTSTQLRHTAAKQLADIAKRAYDRQLDLDPQSNPWPEALRLLSRIVPFLSSKSSDTRNAAGEAIGLIVACLPVWQAPSANAVQDFTSPFQGYTDIASLVTRAPKLLASAGQEYVVTKGSGKDSAKQKKAMMGSLGLAPGVGWGDDVDKVVDEEAGDVKPDPDATVDVEAVKTESGPPTPVPAKVEEEPKDPYEGLSARQINMLKRKRKGGATAMDEANKMRRLNAQAHAGPSPVGAIASPSTASTPAGTPAASPAPTPRQSPSRPEIVTVDPGAKARAAAEAAGGQVEPSPEEAAANALITPADQWPFTLLMQDLVLALGKPAWEARHGAAMAIREILRTQGKGCANALRSVAQTLLALLALDRFGDFVGDMVMAPVREAAAQALGIVLIHLPASAVRTVHDALIQMVRQDWVSKENKYAWEVRHAGLLGLKYQVAVRGDLLGAPKVEGVKLEDAVLGDVHVKAEQIDVKGEDEKKPNGIKREEMSAEDDVKMDGVLPASEQADTTLILKEVVDAAVLGLSDADDDVRSVSAACLLPIANHLVTKLSTPEVQVLLHVLWDCLSEGGDELGSSTGVVMDLLGKLITYDETIDIFCATPVNDPLSVNALVPRLFPYFRHTIAHVRLAVLKALQIFITVDRLPRSWVDDRVFRLIYQNLIVEEKPEIRAATKVTWEAAFAAVDAATFIPTTILPRLADWFTIAMTPMGIALDASLFYRPVADKTLASKSHTGYSGPTYNVDKHMMAGDLSLVSTESILRARIGAAEALAGILKYDRAGATHAELLHKYLGSASAHQLFLAAVIVEEWARVADDGALDANTTSLATTNPVVGGLSAKLIEFLEKPPPATYYEMTVLLTRIQVESQGLITAFAVDGKIKRDKLPVLPQKVDPLSNADDVFSLATARDVAGKHFETFSAALSKAAAKAVLPSLKERQRKLLASIGLFVVMKEKYDVQVFAAMAGATVALRTMPAKLNPIIRSIMNGVKAEDNEMLQNRFAASVGAFVEFCSSPLFGARANPSDKIVKNLCAFLCQDAKETPIFSTTSAKPGIISLQEMTPKVTAKGNVKEELYESDEVIQARVTRRGARLALSSLARRFGSNAFTAAPKLWEGMSGALLRTFPPGQNVSEADEQLRSSNSIGQDVVDCLTVLQTLVADISPELYPRVMDLVKSVILALQSSFAVIRYAAAKCLATICNHLTSEAMRVVVEDVIPFLNDANNAVHRQGAIELIHHIIQLLDMKALPYVLFLIVPTLGRMSDSDVPVRLMATSTFAALVKMVPLEAGIPDPEGFSAELLAKKSEERQFLTQLLDGSKAEQYEIPVPIKAELRNYQKEGVSWLAFLARYQLHGILCDDMGLGKSLQSICILASKHHERAEKFKATGSVDSAHVPSLIVCPPTLTGHWYHEIGKFSDHLRPILYTGNANQRASIFPRLKNYDIVITSYEAVRNDIDELKNVNFLYCVLDEGHIIKNAKTKLTQAVKMIKANHRLLLSGTPIQNNVLELWSLFDFLMPGFLGTDKAFNEKFSKPILADRDGKASPKQRDAATAALEALHKQVLPFLLRRLKEDVLDDLPPKIIQDYYCELSDVQKQLYDEFSKSQSQDLADEVTKGEAGGAGQQHVFQSLQYLRKLCNHPALVLEKEPEKYQQLIAKAPKASIPPSMYEISNAPKLEALRQLLTDCGIGASTSVDPGQPPQDTESQHRVLIFCQLRPMLDLIENHLFKTLMPSVTYMRMDGQTEASKRHAVVQTFNGDPSIDVLLLTTQVGGLGLNLTGADTVIFVDHDWNPMKDLQAMDRAHRLGQKKVVNVYRLITRGTLEEKIMGLQRFKLNIASSVVTQQNSGLASMNTNEVLDLFQVSAEGEPKKPAKAAAGPSTQSSVLEGLEDLPAEDEYEGLSLSSFMAKM